MTDYFPRSRLLLSAGTLVHCPFRKRVAAAAQAGFDAISLFPQQYLDARRRERLTPEDMRHILADGGVSLDEVDPLLDWFEDRNSPEESLVFEIAGELGAGSVNTAPAFAPAGPGLAARLAKLCERAATHGLRINLEFLPWTPVPDLASALQLVRECGQRNVGITLDVWHFYRGGDTTATLAGLTRAEAALISSLQINDAPSRPASPGLRERLAMARVKMGQARDGVRISGARRFFSVVSQAGGEHPDAAALMDEASSARCLPGEGDMPLAEWLEALAGRGCSPTVGLEIFSLALARLPPAEVARRSLAAYREIH